MFDVISVGSATQDVFASSDQTHLIRIQHFEREETYLAYEYGAKVAVDHLFISTGGGATNTAIAFAKLGLQAAAACEVGQDDAGNMIERTLRESGVETRMITRNPQMATGYSVILTGPTGDRTVLVHRGAASYLSHEDINWDLMRQTTWIYLSSLAGPAASLWADVAEFAAEHNLKLAINPGGQQIKLGLEGLGPVLAATDVIFINRTEAYQLTGVEEDLGDEDEKQAVGILREAGCKVVAMTMGGDGVRAFDGNDHHLLPAPKVEVVSNLGAGDAFAAGCLAALHRGFPLREALKVGTINSGSVITSMGATVGLLDWPAIEAELNGK